MRAAGWAETAALAGGYRTAFAVAAALVVAALLVALSTLPGARPAGIDRHVRLTDDTGAGRVVG